MRKKNVSKLAIAKRLSTIQSLVTRPGFTILNQSGSVPTEYGPPKMRDVQLLSNEHGRYRRFCM